METINFYDGLGDHAAQVPNYQVTVAGTLTTTDLNMIKANGQLSTAFLDDFAIYGDQTLTQAVTISPSTTTIDLVISLTNGISFGFYENGNGSCNSATGSPCDALFNGLKFVISAN